MSFECLKNAWIHLYCDHLCSYIVPVSLHLLIQQTWWKLFFSFAQLSILFSYLQRYKCCNVVIADLVGEEKKKKTICWLGISTLLFAWLNYISSQERFFNLLLMTVSLCCLLRMLFLNLDRGFFFYHLIFVFLKSIVVLPSHDNFHEMPWSLKNDAVQVSRWYQKYCVHFLTEVG